MPRTLYPRALGRPRPVLSLNFQPSITNLDPQLTINGETETPMFRYKGEDANASDWPAWGYGTTLSLVSAGTDPLFNRGSPLLGPNDDSVQIRGGDHFADTTATSGIIETEDIVLELVGKIVSGSTSGIVTNRPNSGAGWHLSTNTSRQLVLRFNDGTDTATITANGRGLNSWFHLIAFVNRDEASTNGSSIYINGVSAAVGVDFSSVAESITSTNGLAIGAFTASAGITNSSVSYCAMWKRSDWHQAGASGPTEWALIAKERFAKLTGLVPVSKGTVVPTTMTRNLAAYLDKETNGVRDLFYVDPHWLRTCRRLDSSSVSLQGYLSELAETNLCLQSQTFDTTWLPVDAGDTLSVDAIEAPDGTTTADGIIADSTDGFHGVAQSITLTVATYTFSVWMKAGDRNWGRLTVNIAGPASAYFDLENGEVGTVSTGTAAIENWGNGWYRCSLTFTGAASARSHTIYPADADLDSTVTGDGAAVNIYVWGAQVTLSGFATSYIPTTTVTVARAADVLVFDDDNAPGTTGSFVAQILLPNYDNATARTLVDISDGSSTNQILGYVSTDDVASLFVGNTGTQADITDATTNITSNAIKKVVLTWRTDEFKVFVDGTEEGTADTSGDPPETFTRVGIGVDEAGVRQLGGLISNIKIYNKFGIKN